jgi:hypothetical protein
MLLAALSLALTLSVPPPTPASLLTPIPATGALPFAVNPAILAPSTPAGASQSGYEQSAKDFVRTHFGVRRGTVRKDNLTKIATWKDPAAWQALWDAMLKEKDDVRLALLDHLALQGPLGQAMLAKIAIRSTEPAMRHEATRRIARPACDEVIAMIELGLRDSRHLTVNQAGVLAGKVDAFAVIPSLIFAQVTADEKKETGDLAWIAQGTRTNYIANVQAVVGDGAGAFQPVIGSLQTGVLMRVEDATVYSYRSDAHHALVALTSRDWGQSTADFGWDAKQWWAWFNTEYVPYKRAQAGTSAPSAPPQAPSGQPTSASTAASSAK